MTNTLIGALPILAFQLFLGNLYFANILGFLFGGGVDILPMQGTYLRLDSLSVISWVIY